MLIFVVLLEMLLENLISQLSSFLVYDMFIENDFNSIIWVHFSCTYSLRKMSLSIRQYFHTNLFLKEKIQVLFSFYEKKSIDQVVNNLRKDRNQATFISFIHLVQIHLQAAT